MKKFILLLLLFSFRLFSQELTEKEKIFRDFYSEAIKNFLFEKYDEAETLALLSLKYKKKAPAVYYLLSKIAYAQQDYNKAIAYIKTALQFDDDNFWFWKFYADINIKISDFPKAKQIYEKHIIPYTNNDDDYYQLIAIYDTLHLYRSEIELIKQLRKRQGFTLENFGLAVDVYSKILDTQAIVNEFRNLIIYSDYDPNYLLNVSEAMLSLNKVDTAYYYLTKFYPSPDTLDPQYFYVLTYYYFRHKMFDRFLYSISMTFDTLGFSIDRLWNFFNNNAKFINYSFMGSYLDSLILWAKNYDLSEPVLNNLITVLNKNYRFYFSKSLLEYYLQRVPMSASLAAILFVVSSMILDYQTFEQYEDTLLSYYPNYGKIYLYLALYHLSKRDYPNYNTYIELAKNLAFDNYSMNVLIDYSRYLELYAKGKIRKAQHIFDSLATNVKSFYSCSNLNVSFYSIINIFVKVDQFRFFKNLQECSERKTSDLLVYYDLAILYSLKGDYSSALKEVDNALEKCKIPCPIFLEFKLFLCDILCPDKNLDSLKSEVQKYDKNLQFYKNLKNYLK